LNCLFNNHEQDVPQNSVSPMTSTTAPDFLLARWRQLL